MKVVAYYRVSTAAQGLSGLGLDAQRTSVEAFAKARGAQTLAEYTEIESGKRADRPELLAALHYAKVTGATLVIAKLDRLSRSVAFLATLQDSGARFLAVDMPDANEAMVHVMAAMAQAERKAISGRTRVALQAAKARGRQLGNPNGAAALRRAGKGNGAAIATVKAGAESHAANLATVVTAMRAEGLTSLAALAGALNARHMQTRRGGRWHPSSVRNLLARLDAAG